jgi:predicted NBD/HSP70 family sugar kinase
MSLFGTNLEHGQRYNRRVVLESVRLHGPLSRAEIARRTGLSAQTVSNIMDQLKPADLVVEHPRRTGGRGQPPIDIQINPKGAFAFGISFDQSQLKVIVVNLGGEVCGEIEFALTHSGPGILLPLIESAVNELTAARSIPSERIWGAGVVLPTLVSRGSLTSLGPTVVPEWRGFPLAAKLQERLGFPVLVDNDATAGAIGELLYGAGRRLSDFFYFYIGVGLGGGIVANGRPYRGAYGMSGELAHVVSVPDGRACACGNKGCLERYASLSAAHGALTGREEGSELVDLKRIAAAFASKDRKLMRWIEDCSGHLRNAIVSVENLLDPEAVIVGGLIPDAMLDMLLATIAPLPPSVSSRHSREAPRLLKAAVGLDTRALGAAALAMFDCMTPDFSSMMKQRAATDGASIR